MLITHIDQILPHLVGRREFAVVRKEDDQPTIQNPFFHLCGDKFWQLVPAEGETPIYRKGETVWRYTGKRSNMYQVEHNELFASIRSGKPINNGLYMSNSSMLAILGRMTTYTGKTLSWDQAMASKEDLSPAKYEWGSLATPKVAIPGATEFI